jgi:hypothetical protein
MLEWLRGPARKNKLEVRDALFGEMSLFQWQPKSPDQGEPWTSFARVLEWWDRNNNTDAVSVLESILKMPGLDSRHYLEAWTFLRNHGVFPPEDERKKVLGVIVELGTDDGQDLVAAYSDHHARYNNFLGAVVWERPNDSLDKLIDDLLSAASEAVKVIGPWYKGRPAVPPAGQTQVTILTPSGLHCAQGSDSTLLKDGIGRPILGLSHELIQQLICLTKKP